MALSTYRDAYKKLIAWQELLVLRRAVYRLTKDFPPREHRRIAQMNDAARSAKQNLQEGYPGSLPTYIKGVVISRGSLAELLGDLEDCLEDELINKNEFDRIVGQLRRCDYLLFRLLQSLKRKKDSP